MDFIKVAFQGSALLTQRILTKNLYQNAWLLLTDALALANHDQAVWWKFCQKPFVFAMPTPGIQYGLQNLGPL